MTPVVYLQNQYPNLTETFVSAEIEELRRRGVPVSVVTPKINKDQISLSPHPDIVKAAPSNEAIIEVIKKINPGYIHSHFLTECLSLGLPVAEAFSLPFGFTVHAYDIWKRGARVEPELVAQIGQHPRCQVAAAEGTKHAAWLEWCSVPKEKIIITPNSVDKTRLPACRERLPSKAVKVLCIGRPVPKKGFFDGIDAVRLLRLRGIPLELKILGGADNSKPLGPVIKEYVKNFDFLSATELVPHKEALKELAQSDILIVPSLVAEDGDSDGIPTVLAEAMLLKIPVVTTNVGSITDLVIDGKTGFVARAGDPAAFAAKLLEAVQLYQSKTKLESFLSSAAHHALQQEIVKSVDTLLAKVSPLIGLPVSSARPSTDQIAQLTRSMLSGGPK